MNKKARPSLTMTLGRAFYALGSRSEQTKEAQPYLSPREITFHYFVFDFLLNAARRADFP
jgi:hypothetical protein